MITEFIDFDEQINQLKNIKNLKFYYEEEARKILQRESYYYLIDGYKMIFLKRKIRKNRAEEYRDDVYFEHIYALFCFDTELRNTLFKYILKIESNIKTKISYYFSKEYRNNDNHISNDNNSKISKKEVPYLNPNNYNITNPELVEEVKYLINKLEKTISKQVKIVNSKVENCMSEYGMVPLWILIYQLDFGTTSYFFRCLKKRLQAKIARHINEEFKNEYTNENFTMPFYPESLNNILYFINNFRNICAHGEILYTHKYEKNKIKTTIIHSHYGVEFKYSVFDLILILKIFLIEDDMEEMLSEILRALGILKTSILHDDYKKILQKMGFPNDYKNFIGKKENDKK